MEIKYINLKFPLFTTKDNERTCCLNISKNDLVCPFLQISGYGFRYTCGYLLDSVFSYLDDPSNYLEVHKDCPLWNKYDEEQK